jgi:DNA (cytosine-5)-methyltransferase 1
MMDLGLEYAGHDVVWQVEKEPYARRVLAKHWPTIERFEDVCTVGAHNLAPVDLIAGGSPCQDISSAGKGAGLAGSRSGLWWEFARVVSELRPEWVIVENVASGAKRWVDQVRASLGGLGYETLAIPLSAKDVGAPHLRRRIFLVASHPHRQSQSTISEHGEVARLQSDSRPTPNPKRNTIREQQRRCGGQDGQRETVFGYDGEEGDVADTSGDRRTPERERATNRHPDWGCELRYGIETGKIPQPGIRRVDDGSTSWVVRNSSSAPIHNQNRLARLRGLGNGCVVQCAEVIGEILNELLDL